MAKFSKLREMLKCNQPKMTPSHPVKKAVVKACEDGKEKIVRFGDKNMSIKKHIPERKKSYCARSKGIGQIKNKLSANYWSRKAWKCK